MLQVAKGIAGDRVPQAEQGHDVAGVALRHFLAAALRVGVNVVDFADQFLHVPAGVEGPALRLEHAGVDAQEEDVAVLVRHDLEDQGAERFLRIGLALLFLVRLLGDCPVNRRPIERARQGNSVTASISG